MSAASAVVAQEQPKPTSSTADASDRDDHPQTSSDIIVTAPFDRDRRDVLSGVSVLKGAELTQSIRPTIGETLARTPGVSATSFGPNASRPVLRGLQGERVRVLTDGIGSTDVSNISVDHAVVVNPLLAERIEVLRGSAALLYGSSAIGGVVNVLDKRIPRTVPTEFAHIDATATYGSAANERAGGASVDVPIGDKFVVHADGDYIKTDDLRIGGYVLAPIARRQALASSLLPADPDSEVDFAGNAALRGKLPNSASKTWTAGIGAAVITDTGNLGVSYSHYDSFYGIPARYATLPGEEQEFPRLDVIQNRVDARAEVQTGGGFLKTIRARAGYASYRHFELEPDGAIGTAFYNKGLEGRLELVQAERGGWSGATGVQYASRDFQIVGVEAFSPKSATEQLGVFTLQQFELGAIKLEAGGRYENTKLNAKPTPDQPQFFGGTRTFDAFSVSGGASYKIGGDTRIGLNVSRTERAPAAEELFSNGPHAGTQAFEVGNPDFRTEKSLGVEGIFRSSGKRYTFEASAYYNWFTDFIYEDRTGVIEDGLPIFQFAQAKARYYGFEAQASFTVAQFGDVGLVADGLADYVRANVKNAGPAPRIPPLRVIGGIGLTSPKADGRVSVEYSDSQRRITTFETPTDSFTLVNAEINFRPWGRGRPLSFALSANNIFDVDARRHASFLKDFAPLAGRDFRITARASF
jgi:iron complex outermembrane receptor protein